MSSLIHLVTKDAAKVKVSLPGQAIVNSNRFGEGSDKLHQRIRDCLKIMQRSFGYNINANLPKLYLPMWKRLFLSVDLPDVDLLLERQLALDLAASDAKDLFGDEFDEERGVFLHNADQVLAFLAAKELIPPATTTTTSNGK